jgi:hypothetical protein
MSRLDHAKQSALEIARTRYPDAKAVLLSGSVLRGHDTPYSDLDIVVLYEILPNAKRESFIHNNWPVEAFINDPETIRYFCEEFDLKSFEPIMPTMLMESILVAGDEEFVKKLRDYASDLIDNGPKSLSLEEHQRFRYAITDTIDDLRHPKGQAEMQASGVVLYSQIANYFFRSRNLWCARSKTIPRKLREADASFADKFASSFDKLFAGDVKPVIQLAEELLSPHGGFLFEGYSLDAPAHFRKPF